MRLIKSRIVLLIAVITMFFTVFIFLTNNHTTKIYRLDEIGMTQEDIYVLEDDGYVDVILAGLSILVTAILGYVTYVQTKEAMRLDAIDKTPYFQISNFCRFEQINQKEYHVGSGQYGFVPRLLFVTCDSSDSGLVFKIMLKNVTENTIAKANVYYSEEKINSYTQLKKLPISEGLNKVIKNANQMIALMEVDGRDINEIIESLGEDGKHVREVVVARDETQRVLNEIEELYTPDMLDCKKEDECEIELVTYFDEGEDISKYLNNFAPVNFYIAIDMETIHGYRYTQVIFLALRYANIFSVKDKPIKLVFSVQDFESKIIPVSLEKVNWEKDCYNSKLKDVSKKIMPAKKIE